MNIDITRREILLDALYSKYKDSDSYKVKELIEELEALPDWTTTLSEETPVLCKTDPVNCCLRLIVDHNPNYPAPYKDMQGYWWVKAIPVSLDDYKHTFIR